MCVMFFFKQKTADEMRISDWSSDVCSSDLEQRVAVDDHRQRLDQGDVVVALHRAGQAHDGVAGHQAVRVEDQELRVRRAPVPHPVGDVAGLALAIGRESCWDRWCKYVVFSGLYG